MENNRKKNLTSYVDAMNEASTLIVDENPDFIIAPMLGSVPFIDAMTIVNPDFDPSKVVYMPASSKIEDVNRIISEWYFNFLEDSVDSPSYFPKILGIDEVVSGGSVTRCLHQIDIASNKKKKKEIQSIIGRLHSQDKNVAIKALNEADILTNQNYSIELSEIKDKVMSDDYFKDKDLARKNYLFVRDSIKPSLTDKLTYRTIGIEDSKLNGKRNKEYKLMKEEGRITPISTNKIISMDIPDFCPPRFDSMSVSKGRFDYMQFLPSIKDFKVTPQYIEFLQNLAKHVGTDSSKVYPVNMSQMLDSNKYLNRD